MHLASPHTSNLIKFAVLWNCKIQSHCMKSKRCVWLEYNKPRLILMQLGMEDVCVFIGLEQVFDAFLDWHERLMLTPCELCWECPECGKQKCCDCRMCLVWSIMEDSSDSADGKWQKKVWLMHRSDLPVTDAELSCN